MLLSTLVMKSLPILHIALPVPLYQSFDYLTPQDRLQENIQIGSRVRVAFGSRKLTGIIIGKAKTSVLPQSKLKKVGEILDTQPVFDVPLLKLLFWTANYYQQPIGEVLNAALPKKLRQGKFITPVSTTLYKISDAMIENNTFDRAPKQQLLYKLLKNYPDGLDSNSISKKISNWHPIANALIKKNILTKFKCVTNNLTNDSKEKIKSIFLNKEQQDVYNNIYKELDKYNCHLIAGVTGSGKTEVYLALAKNIIENHKQALFLVPEIGLTPQLVKRIESRLGIQVSIMHSNLNEAERSQTWLAANTGKANIIVGTRSAIFMPFKNLGLIVVDEEHDLSFKQQEGFLYHARDIAIYRSKQLNIPIVLGSATPSFESLQNVNTGKYKKYTLRKRAQKTTIPQVKLIDMRSKSVSEGLSNELVHAISNELSKNHQVLLFLNRRGYAPTVLCQECGWIAECSRCDARMTFYKNKNVLKCHHCLKEQIAPSACTECNSDSLLLLGEGTQRVENKLKEIFPNTAITRIDRDSTRKKNILQNKLNDIHNGKYKIILGTQMISKGHDFPGVSLVGILNVDHGLFSTDFRATERLAQLIVQVSGRAGRSKIKGKVLLQTYQPEHPLLNCLLNKGYDAFSNEALKIRKSSGLPPYTFIAIVRARANRQSNAQRFLQDIKNTVLINSSPKLNIVGPISAMLERKAGMYQSQLIIISPSRNLMQQHLGDWIKDIPQHPLSKNVRWSIEVDPLEME